MESKLVRVETEAVERLERIRKTIRLPFHMSNFIGAAIRYACDHEADFLRCAVKPVKVKK